LPGGAMKADRKQRADEEGAPPGEASGGAFGIALGKAMAVVMQMRGLDRVHAAQHESAQSEENEVLHPPRDADAVMLCSMGEAQASEEKVKRSEGAKNELAARIEPN